MILRLSRACSVLDKLRHALCPAGAAKDLTLYPDWPWAGAGGRYKLQEPLLALRQALMRALGRLGAVADALGQAAVAARKAGQLPHALAALHRLHDLGCAAVALKACFEIYPKYQVGRLPHALAALHRLQELECALAHNWGVCAVGALHKCNSMSWPYECAKVPLAECQPSRDSGAC